MTPLRVVVTTGSRRLRGRRLLLELVLDALEPRLFLDLGGYTGTGGANEVAEQ